MIGERATPIPTTSRTATFGILLLLLLTGMETDLRLVRRFGRAALSVSSMGVAVPFVCGLALGAVLPDMLLPASDKRLVTSLFLGTAFAISSIKIVAAIVHEMNFTRRDLGQIIVSSAIMEDTIGWVIIAITSSLAAANTIQVFGLIKALIGTAAFLVASFTVGRWFVIHAIRWANDHFESEFPVITTILLVMGGMALTTEAIGVNTVLGAFIAGVLIGELPILTRHIEEQLRGLIVAFFMPVFFGLAGLGTDLTILKDPHLLLLTLAIVAVASVGKFGGAFAGGAIGGLTRREALALAFAMNARGSTEVIVATIGLSMGALTQNLFTMIVAMAVVTTLAMPPMLRRGLASVPISDAEKQRLDREESDAKAFVPNLERLLLAVDHSANGRFASRLAGLIAGPRGLPTTVLPSPGTAEATKDFIVAAAEDSNRAQREEDRTTPAEVTVRTVHAAPEDAVAHEARKGYDLLFVGIEHTRTQSGAFHPDVARVLARFDGPQAIVAAQGVHLVHPDSSQLRILVPVNGAAPSRRAAEIAIALAHALDAPIAALYVSTAKPDPRRRSRTAAKAAQARAILKDIVMLADQYGQKVDTVIDVDVAADEAILRQARRRGSNLIVMGVTPRPGERLFFGETAASVFEATPSSVLLLST